MYACSYTDDTASQLGVAANVQHTQEQVPETTDCHKNFFCRNQELKCQNSNCLRTGNNFQPVHVVLFLLSHL